MDSMTRLHHMKICQLVLQWNLRFSQQQVRRRLSSGMLCHVVWYKLINVSEALTVSLIMVTRMTKAVCTTERSLNLHWPIWCNVPKYRYLHLSSKIIRSGKVHVWTHIHMNIHKGMIPFAYNLSTKENIILLR